jgi:hypothetical protein
MKKKHLAEWDNLSFSTQLPLSEEPLTSRKIVLTKVLAPFMISLTLGKTTDTQAQEIKRYARLPKMKHMISS